MNAVMGIFPNTDEAMMKHERLDHVGRWLITIGQLFTQIGTRIVQSRNELLSAALQEQEDRIHVAYRAGRNDEREGVPDLEADEDEDQGDEDQGHEDQGDGMVWTVDEDELNRP